MIKGCPETEPIMIQAWGDFLLFAVSQPEIRKQFESDTGLMFPKTEVDNMIDQCTDYETERLERFVEWATETMWGNR